MSLLETANRHARHPASQYLVSQARRLATRSSRPNDLIDAVETYLSAQAKSADALVKALSDVQGLKPDPEVQNLGGGVVRARLETTAELPCVSGGGSYDPRSRVAPQGPPRCVCRDGGMADAPA